MRKRATRKERFETTMKVLKMHYEEKAINPEHIARMVNALEQIIFCKKSEKNIKNKLEELQRNHQDYRAELKNAFQCQELIRHFKLTLIEEITKL